MSSASYSVDPADPRAPSQDIWDALSPEERLRIVETLPSEFSWSEPPEGDAHRVPKTQAEQALRHHFERRRRRVYLSSELPIYYPEERVFAPDLIAVVDVDPRPRSRWVVSAEKRGLDFVLEVVVSGNPKKDFVDNVQRYGRLGIPEYFVYSPARVEEKATARLVGYRLEPGETTYSPIMPQGGRWPSSILDLDLILEDGRLRFAIGDARLPDLDELVQRLEGMVDDITARERQLLEQLSAERERADAEAGRAQTEAERAQTEAERAQTEAERARRLADRLRKLGVDPDEV